MEECMRECMRKLALWYTRTFKPIMTHEELEPIMATLGFVPLPSSNDGASLTWKEYVYSAGGWRRSPSPDEHLTPQPPRPRLPFPRIDGLHICTYRAFLDAVNFYLEMSDFSDLFHVRGMPLHRVHDRSKKWRRMEEDDSVFVYREGTLDQATYALYNKSKNEGSSGSKACNPMLIRNKGNNNNGSSSNNNNNAPTTTKGCIIVPLKDIIV